MRIPLYNGGVVELRPDGDLWSLTVDDGERVTRLRVFLTADEAALFRSELGKAVSA